MKQVTLWMLIILIASPSLNAKFNKKIFNQASSALIGSGLLYLNYRYPHLQDLIGKYTDSSKRMSFVFSNVGIIVFAFLFPDLIRNKPKRTQRRLKNKSINSNSVDGEDRILKEWEAGRTCRQEYWGKILHHKKPGGFERDEQGNYQCELCEQYIDKYKTRYPHGFCDCKRFYCHDCKKGNGDLCVCGTKTIAFI